MRTVPNPHRTKALEHWAATGDKSVNEHREMTPEFVAWLETMQPRTTTEARAAWYGWKAATSESRVWLVRLD